ncbi:hypothetical protein ACMFMG_003105 [Clarireedia jacksonii]
MDNMESFIDIHLYDKRLMTNALWQTHGERMANALWQTHDKRMANALSQTQNKRIANAFVCGDSFDLTHCPCAPAAQVVFNIPILRSRIPTVAAAHSQRVCSHDPQSAGSFLAVHYPRTEQEYLF